MTISNPTSVRERPAARAPSLEGGEAGLAQVRADWILVGWLTKPSATAPANSLGLPLDPAEIDRWRLRRCVGARVEVGLAFG